MYFGWFDTKSCKGSNESKKLGHLLHDIDHVDPNIKAGYMINWSLWLIKKIMSFTI